MLRFLWLAVLLFGLVLPAPAVVAQDENPFADLGLPEINANITDGAIEGVDHELAAGRYLVSVTNRSKLDSVGLAFLRVPDGMTADDILGVLAGFAAETEMAALPEWYYQTALAGGITAGADATAFAVVDLPAGEWIAWGGDPSTPQAPVVVTVTGELPANLPEPEADVTVTMTEMSFALDGPLPAGSPIIKLTNIGEQPHFLYMDAVPANAMPEDFLALMASFMDPAAAGTPTAIGPDEYVFTAASGDLSSGATMWLSPELAAGTYQLVCLIPDIDEGVPHAMLGMIEIVTAE